MKHVELLQTARQALALCFQDTEVACAAMSRPQRHRSLCDSCLAGRGVPKAGRPGQDQRTAAFRSGGVLPVAKSPGGTTQRIRRGPRALHHPRVRGDLPDAGFGYVDLAGNCRLSTGAIYIERRGQPNPFIRKARIYNLYKPVASRVLRVLLHHPPTPWKLKELAKEALRQPGARAQRQAGPAGPRVDRRRIEDHHVDPAGGGAGGVGGQV